MKRVPFGKTGARVSRMCLGTMMFARRTDEPEAERILAACIERGVDNVDTAASYAEGACEELVGRIIKGRRQKLFLGTKVSRTTDAKWIKESLDDSLRRLQVDHVDLFIIHWPRQRMKVEAMMRALDEGVRAGKTRFIGCSNFPAWLLAHCNVVAERNGWAKLVCNQVNYSATVRGVEVEVLPQALAEGIAITTYQPLMAGVLAGKYDPGQAAPDDSRGATDKRMQAWTDDLGDRVMRFESMARHAAPPGPARHRMGQPLAGGDIADRWLQLARTGRSEPGRLRCHPQRRPALGDQRHLRDVAGHTGAAGPELPAAPHRVRPHRQGVGKVIELIRTVRQARQYGPEPVTAEQIEQLLEVARWTGSSVNSQPWHFIAVTDRTKLRQIAQLRQRINWVAEAPLAIAIVLDGKSSRSEAYDEGRVTERLLIAARSLGLGGGVAFYGDESQQAEGKRILGIPADKVALSVVVIGHATSTKDPRRTRTRPGASRWPRSPASTATGARSPVSQRPIAAPEEWRRLHLERPLSRSLPVELDAQPRPRWCDQMPVGEVDLHRHHVRQPGHRLAWHLLHAHVG